MEPDGLGSTPQFEPTLLRKNKWSIIEWRGPFVFVAALVLGRWVYQAVRFAR